MIPIHLSGTYYIQSVNNVAAKPNYYLKEKNKRVRGCLLALGFYVVFALGFGVISKGHSHLTNGE